MAEEKLRPKYLVFKIDEKGETYPEGMKSTDPDDIDSPFVLMPRKDPAAFYALLHYAQACEDDLGRPLRMWLDKITDAPPVYGTQGERNWRTMKKHQMDIIT